MWKAGEPISYPSTALRVAEVRTRAIPSTTARLRGDIPTEHLPLWLFPPPNTVSYTHHKSTDEKKRCQ